MSRRRSSSRPTRPVVPDRRAVPRLSAGHAGDNAGEQLAGRTGPGTVRRGRFFLQNEFVRAEIGDDGRVLVLMDRQRQANLLSNPGNDLVFYNDSGNDYRFGNERANDPNWQFTRITPAWSAAARTVLETGPVRLRVRCEATATVNGAPYTYVREYCWSPARPFLRVANTSGVAPEKYLGLHQRAICRHQRAIRHDGALDDLLPTPDSSTWPAPYFFVSHDFVIATANGNPAAAVYHECVPCWSLSNGALFGCLARNPDAYNTDYGAAGTDFDRFTQVYALRVGTQVCSPPPA